MKILVTGVAGQLGHDVMNELNKRGYEGVGSDVASEYSGTMKTAVEAMPYVSMDITNEELVAKVILDVKPDAIIHCAAWTAVDAAEDEENIPKVTAINVDGTRYIAKAAKTVGAKMMYISTDYVFNGEGNEPFEADCIDYAPLSVYGETKLQGENAVREIVANHFIVRIAWVFGLNGNNFINTMLRVGRKFDTLKVVNDQIGTPTYTFDLARLLVDMIETEKYGTYHATNEGGFISWYDFAVEIFKQAEALGYEEYSKKRLTVLPVTTEEYGVSKAKRPFNSRLDKSKLIKNGFTPLPAWQDAVERYMKEDSLWDKLK